MRNKFLKLFFWLIIAPSILCGTAQASSNDNDLVQKWLDKIASNEDLLKTSVGQLFIVGTRSDYSNTYSSKTNKLIQELNPGGFIFHNYNYPIKSYKGSDRFNVSQNLHRSILETYINNATIKLPPFFAADFESLSSWGNSLSGAGLVAPPTALSLSVSNNSEKVQEIGMLIGRELKVLGINMLLGPVVDVDRQNHYTTAKQLQRRWGPRKYGATSDVVMATAWNYLTGLNETGLMTVLKHFPGLGDYDINLHSKNGVPKLIYDPDVDFIPFKELAGLTSGIMTSHVELNGKLVTINSRLIKDSIKREIKQEDKNSINKIVNNKLLLITDDLSDMGPINLYRSKNNISWGELALEAFRAGHDLLLFAHLKGRDIEKSPTMSDLLAARDLIYDTITRNPVLKAQFLNSLKRIANAKVRYWKKDGFKVSDILNGEVNIKYKENDAITEGVQIGEKIVKLNDDYLASFFSGIYTDLNEQNKLTLKNKSITLFVPKSKIDYFNDISENHPVKEVIALKERYKKSDKKEEWNKFINYLKRDEVDFVAIIPKMVEHYHMLDYVQLYYNDYLSKIIILEHSNPKNISRKVGLVAKVVGVFSWHPVTFKLDLAYLSGDLEAKSSKGFPISYIKTVSQLTPDVMDMPASKAIYSPVSISNLNSCKNQNARLKSDIEDLKIKGDLLNVGSEKYQCPEGENDKASRQKIYNDYYLISLLLAISAAAMFSIHRQGLTVYDHKQGGIAYIIDSVIVNRKNLPYGMQESLSVLILSLLGIVILLSEQTHVLITISLCVLILPTLLGFLRHFCLLNKCETVRSEALKYLYGRLKNRQVMVYFLLGIVFLFIYYHQEDIKVQVILDVIEELKNIFK